MLPALRDPGQEPEVVVLQHIHTLVVGAQVVDLRMKSRLCRGFESNIDKVMVTCFLKIDPQKSLQINFMRSSSSLNFGDSLVSRSISLNPALNPSTSRSDGDISSGSGDDVDMSSSLLAFTFAVVVVVEVADDDDAASTEETNSR